MKMRDVFELPVDATDVLDRVSFGGFEHCHAATHAINCHDGLVDAVDVLLNHPDLAHRGAIRELLTRAKGES